jgi:hypothetical protein
MKNIWTFLKQFNYLKALPLFAFIVAFSIIESIFFNMYMIWWLVLIVSPLIYILSCIKTPFERKLDSFHNKMNLAYSETDLIKQATLLCITSMEISNECVEESKNNVDDKYWTILADFYANISENWNKELQILVAKK